MKLFKSELSKRDKFKKSFLICFILALGVAVCCSVYGDLSSDDFKVCIDAGHGGDSIGAVYGNDERLEKDDNLRLAQLLKDELKKHSVDVIMTRNGDTEVSLSKRCRIANMNKADYFVCLHRNSSDDTTACGTEMWISNSSTELEKAYAESILAKLEGVGISSNRGIKNGYRDGDGDYYINAYTDMPSCLVELGFISNKEDNNEYDKNIEEYAKAIAEAIIETYEKEKANQ